MLLNWTCGSGRLTLAIGLDDALSASHSGQCDDDVAALRRSPAIAAQVDAWDAEALRDELREYGAWDAADLADDDENRSRMLWLACGDIAEEWRGAEARKILCTDSDDGSDAEACTFGEFLEANADGIDDAEAREIWAAIAEGGTYHGGGGAAAAFRVWLADSTPEAPR